MKKSFTVIVERDSEGRYIASVPALHGCHTQAPTLELLEERIREAIELCLEVRAGQVKDKSQPQVLSDYHSSFEVTIPA